MTKAAGSSRGAESLNWAASSRDDAVVAAAMLAGADLHGLYCLGHARIADLLFSDKALMRRLGFNAHRIRVGLSIHAGSALRAMARLRSLAIGLLRLYLPGTAPRANRVLVVNPHRILALIGA